MPKFMKMKLNNLLMLLVTLSVSACGGGSDGGGNTTATGATTIDVFDGAAIGCSVFVNGVAATEVGDGAYSFDGTVDDGVIIRTTGCTDSDTGLLLPDMSGVAQAGGGVVSPITTLIVESALASNPTATSLSSDVILAAVESIITSLGLTGYDPIDPATANYIAAAKSDIVGTGVSAAVMRVAMAISTLLKGVEIAAGTTDAGAAVTAIAQAISGSPTTVDLSSSTAIESLISDASAIASTSVASALTVAGTAVASSVAIIINMTGSITGAITVAEAIATILNSVDQTAITTSDISTQLTAAAAAAAVDTTAPTVSSTTPATSAIAVARNNAITATFNEDLFATTVDATSFTLANSSTAAGAVTFDATTSIATFTPTDDLALMSTYTATLSAGITDLSGNALTEPYSWNFTTEDGQWGTAQEIEIAVDSAIYPQVSSDPNGNAIAVWMQKYSENQYRVWTNRYTQETDSWTTASLIENTLAEDSAGYPEIAMDKNGNGLAIWKKRQGVNNSIWSRRYNAFDNTWSDSQLISIETAESVAFSEVAFDNQGNAVAVWNQSDWDEGGNIRNIWANRYSVVDNSWGSAVAIDQAENNTYEPKIAVDHNGNALVVWHQRGDTAVNSIWANRYDAESNSWGTPVVIEAEDGDASLPTGVSNAQVAIDTEGNGIAVWSQHDGTEDSIWVNRYDLATTSWGAASLIENDEGYARAPQVAVDSLGNAMVLWYQSNGNLDTTRFNRYSVTDNSWGMASEIEIGAGYAYGQQVAFDASNNALAVWKQADGAIFSVRAIRYVAATNSWGASVKIESDLGQTDHPQLSIDGFGNAWAIWQQDDSALTGTQYSVRANRFD
jgi:hypothetical protein